MGTNMTWQIYTLLSILLFSLNNLFHRTMMKEESSDPFAQTIMFYGLGGVFAFIMTFFRGGFHYQISSSQLPYFLLLTFFATAAPVLGFKALKLIESSENSILSSSQRIWALFGAFVFLQEQFSIHKIIGTLIILGGIMLAQWKKTRFVFNTGAMYAILAAVFYAITEIISFYILRGFDANSFIVYSSLLPVLALFIIRPSTIGKLRFYLKPSRAWNISIVSINDILATIFIFYAYQLGRNATLIGPLMATQSIVSVLLAIIILKERDNMFDKILGACLVVGGVMLVL